MKLQLFFTFLLSLFLFQPTVFGQNDTIKGIVKLRKLIKDDKIKSASIELKNQIDYFTATKNYDTLVHYVEFVGSYSLANKNWDVALSKAKRFVEELKKQNSPKITAKALKELAWIYDENGKPNLAYKTIEKALVHANQIKTDKMPLISSLNYNLAYYASAMGSYALSKKHYFKSLKLLKQKKKQNYVFYQQVYNSIGGLMWREGKLDSCNFYFKKSLDALKNTKNLPINKYYRTALVKMNIAVVSNVLGENYNAISYSEEAIDGFQKFIKEGKDEQKKNAAKKSQLAVIDNLGLFYNAVGEFTKAENLITYAYLEKKKILKKDSPELMISKVVLAQTKLNTQDLIGAAKLLDQVIKPKNESQSYWFAAALSARGKIHEQFGEIDKASVDYDKSQLFFHKSLQGNYNDEFLMELNAIGIFYAKNGNKAKADAIVKETNTAIQKSTFKNTLQELKNIIAIAEIHYQLKEYIKAKKYSQKALNFKITNAKQTIQDSVQIQFDKPRALFINTKSQYQVQKNRNKPFLTKILNQIQIGLNILEQRKTIIKSHSDLNELITQNTELINFAKQIRLELYHLTNEQQFLEDVITLHESAIYNRIRARLNLKNKIKFFGISKKITDREIFLKENLSNTLKFLKDKGITSFISANKEFSVFLDSLKLNYPKYYKMRYATFEQSLDQLQENIPKNTSVVRYLFIEDILYAFVINQTEKEIFKLNFETIKNDLYLQENQFEVQKINATLFKLYQHLWQPFADKITTEHVIIIPDKELFNLSFELLTPKKINSFKELATNSLLAKHIISYNYSLLLLDKNRKTIDYSNNFIAFAPEFTDQMKKDYKIAITDSIVLDKTYLKLLPQPFSVDLIKETSRLFNGSTFVNKNSTKQIFINNAKEHKIIHIGTHAESNNISPELSRLIFAKNATDSIFLNDNSLYTYEIYNQNLSSNLAILTACETGKPTYQAGEGMISLAHAFNYAGSESILTSLWKIDEQSSSEIISSFYDYITKGLSKDKALLQAKLDYISTAQGRTISPQYWAGLVLIGDVSPIAISTTSNNLVFLIFGSLILILIVAFFRKKVIK